MIALTPAAVVSFPGVRPGGPIRSLHLNDARTWRGGEQQTLYLLEGLRRRGHEVALAAQPGSPVAEQARARGFATFDLPVRGEYDLLAAYRFSRIVRRVAPDLVHYHTSHAHAIGAAATAFIGRRRRPRTVLSRRVDFSIYRHNFLGLNGIKYRIVDRIVAISRAIRDILIADGIDPARIDVVRSGIDPARFAGVAPHDLGREMGLEGARVVLNVAALAGHKGQIHLVEAAPAILRSHPEALIAIVGEGECREPLERRIAELGAGERVRLLGFRRDVPALLRGAELFVMPSSTEGLGTAVLDALCCALPVVGARAGGIPEMIEDGRNGLLVPPCDPAALARAVVRLLDDPSLARTIGARGPETIAARFSVDRMVEENLAVYGRVLASGA